MRFTIDTGFVDDDPVRLTTGVVPVPLPESRARPSRRSRSGRWARRLREVGREDRRSERDRPNRLACDGVVEDFIEGDLPGPCGRPATIPKGPGFTDRSAPLGARRCANSLFTQEAAYEMCPLGTLVPSRKLFT